MPGSLPGETPSPIFSRSPRVVILSAAVGAGHVRAVARPFASLDIVHILATRLCATPPGGPPALSPPQPAHGHRPSRRRRSLL